MSYSVRPYSTKDYSLLTTWWSKRAWPPLPPQRLPVTGVIGEIDNIPVGACFLFKTDSSDAQIGWPVADPASNKAQRHELFMLILKKLTDLAREAGYERLVANISHPSFGETLIAAGYKATEPSISHWLEIK